MGKRSTRYAAERFENPKVYNPYGFHRPFIFRLKGSVIPKVLPQTILVTILAAVITYLYEETPIKLGMKASFITSLGLVVSLLLAYRTNTAYDRYWEGLRVWYNMVIAIRNMSRCIWVNVNVEDYENKDIDDKKRAEHLVEKKTAINLLLGFAIATKHYLREEPIKFEDLKSILSKTDLSSPGVQIPINENQDQFSDNNSSNNSNGNNNNSGTFSEKFMKNIKKLMPTFDSNREVNYNLPYQLTLYLSSYIHKQQRTKTTTDSTVNVLYANLNTLTDCLTNFERILRSPIPLAYAIHLTQATWIYCLAIPFQLVIDHNWITIPITFFVTFTLLGVEKIGSEIENPFGWDENDLPLDDFCGILNRELNNITSEPIPPVDEWIFTKNNVPFETDNINALQARNLELDEVKSLLSLSSPRQSMTVNNNLNSDESDKKGAENENVSNKNIDNNDNNNNTIEKS